MRTLPVLSSMVDSPDAIIYEGALDRISFPVVQLKSKRGRPRKVKNMATTSTVPEETKTPVDYESMVGKITEDRPEIPVPDPVTPYKDAKFKLKGNGYHIVARKVFDLESLEKKSLHNVFKVDNFTTVEQLENIPDEQLLALVNLGRQKEALMTAKQAIGGTNAKGVNDFINQFRFLPQFAKLAAPEDAPASVRSEKRKAQTKSIMDFIKGYEPLYKSLKEAAANANAEPEEEEDEE